MLQRPNLIPLCIAFVLGCGGETPAPAPEPPAVSFEQADRRIDVQIGGEPFTSFHYEEKWDKPFLYPIRTASGREISRGYPLRTRPGEHTDHIWHRGVWWGHGEINGGDFWREQGRDKTGRLVPVSPPTADGAAVSTELALQPPEGDPLGTVRETFEFSGDETLRIIDATIEIRADQGVPLVFGDTEDGGFGVRLADAFRQDMGATLRNAEGLEGTENIWGKRSKWVDYSTAIDGGTVGVAVFDHPDNLRHPTGWHARGYSLNAANPFAAGDFSGEPADESYTIPAGESVTLRYRIVIHEGRPDIESLWRQYAETRP